MEELGGPEAHGPKSGVVHLITKTESQAFDKARRLIGLLAGQGDVDPAAVGGASPRQRLPDSLRQAYDVTSVARVGGSPIMMSRPRRCPLTVPRQYIDQQNRPGYEHRWFGQVVDLA